MSQPATSASHSKEDATKRMSIASVLNPMQGAQQDITTPPLDQQEASITSPDIMHRDASRKLTRCRACETWFNTTSLRHHTISAKHEKNLESYLNRELCVSTSAPTTKDDSPKPPAPIPGRKGKPVVWTRNDDEIILEGWFKLRDAKEVAREIGKTTLSVDQRRITLMKDDSPSSLYLTILRRYNPQSR